MAVKYGIGEIFGQDFASLSSSEIRKASKCKHRKIDCPFKSGKCNKAGGVCSLQAYSNDNNTVEPVDDTLVATCPNRFYENNLIFRWVGNEMIGSNSPIILTELPFLMAQEANQTRAVGRIDMVLVNMKGEDELDWCALEMQSVYFSGRSITEELRQLRNYRDHGTPFPIGTRRPDFRSSGPKRLMPQLQIKVPTITRWGKKTVVIVDRPFWNSLGEMPTVDHVSNCDIAWFVLDYQRKGNKFEVQAGDVFLTTLDRAVEGLTGGTPTSLAVFEKTLRERLN